VLVDGTLAECDRVSDSQGDYSGKHRKLGVNIQAVTGAAGELIWYSPTMPGRTRTSPPPAPTTSSRSVSS
jgi:hypothetical protein